MSEVKEPESYIGKLQDLRERNKYAKSWILRIEKKTNKHSDDYGSWGWYEILPLGIEVGYWNAVKDDLKNFDISGWNERAHRISFEGGRDEQEHI